MDDFENHTIKLALIGLMRDLPMSKKDISDFIGSKKVSEFYTLWFSWGEHKPWAGFGEHPAYNPYRVLWDLITDQEKVAIRLRFGDDIKAWFQSLTITDTERILQSVPKDRIPEKYTREIKEFERIVKLKLFSDGEAL